MGFSQLASGDSGTIYGIHDDGRLLFFQDLLRNGKNAPDGSTGWADTTGNQIGQAGRDLDNQQRPDIEQISTRYEQMQAELWDRLTAEIGGPAWSTTTTGDVAAASSSPTCAKESRSLARWTAR